MANMAKLVTLAKEINEIKSTLKSVVLIEALILWSLLNGCAPPPQSVQESRMYAPEAIREDFTTLYQNLQASAYDLFIYTDKAEYDVEYERLLGTITEPMTAHEVSRLFQSFVVMAKMSHCTLEFPIEAFRDWYESGGHFIPFDVVFDGDRVLIAVDW